MRAASPAAGGREGWPRRWRAWLGGLGLGVLVAAGSPAGARESRVVILATTTSIQDSGLLDVLLPRLERCTGYTVKTLAVGTGQALALGDRGEADVVLVHAPDLERRYLARGTLVRRRRVMHNDFVLLGPPEDPAGVGGLRGAVEAFGRLAARGAPFVSRGDGSGTHEREQALWRAAGARPGGGAYLESGQGMGTTLILASEKRAYTLADRASYLALRAQLRLAVLVEGDPALLNVYHVLEVDPARRPRVNGAGGRALADFLVSAEAQTLIGSFGVERYGRPLFVPAAGPPARDGG